MSRLRLVISISLDGYAAGPHQSFDEPLGVGGEQLHEWVVPLAAWREAHGRESGDENASSAVVEAERADVRATIMGRNMFGGHPGGWDDEEPWQGWWGEEPPFHHEVFVVTHHARGPLVLGDTTFTFVTDGIAAALEQARAVAGEDGVINLGGGADIANQYLAAGLVDEVFLHVAPVLLGGGARLFDGAGTDLHGLRLDRSVDAPGVTHILLTRD